MHASRFPFAIREFLFDEEHLEFNINFVSVIWFTEAHRL